MATINSISAATLLVASSFSCELSAAFSSCRLPAVGPLPCRSAAPRRRRPMKLDQSESDRDESPKHVSSSERERRAEEGRRKARLHEGFATPGLSSAIPGARDFVIDVAKTEREYMQSLSSSDDDSVVDAGNVDKFVAMWTEEGLSHLRMLRLEEASESFGKVYRIKPDAYLWHDGLVKYYLDDYHGAAESLSDNAFRYETRFMEPASEERIWRDAAELKIVHSLNGGRRTKERDIPAAARVPLEEGMDAEEAERENIVSERRKVLRIARQLFSNSLRDNPAGMALARAQLQALCGNSFPPLLKSTLPTMPRPVSSPSSMLPDRKMYRLHSLFYLGLHYDALGQPYESKLCMKMALRTCANSISGNNQDITYLLPVIHMTVRDWYDDDELDEGPDGEGTDFDEDDATAASAADDGGVDAGRGEVRRGTKTSEDGPDANSGDESPANVERRLREGIRDMRVADLRGALRRRKLRVTGTKGELRDRLVEDMMNDAGGAARPPA